MGTDIHTIVQVRRSGTWERVSAPDALGDRNYNLFAVLGDVRNGFGFAGIKTSSGFDPISSSRGLPEDVGFTVDEQFVHCARHYTVPHDDDALWDCDECSWLGDHSYGYVTLRELLDYDWDGKTTELTGVVPLLPNDWVGSVSYEEYRATGEFLSRMPTSYSGGVSGPNVVTIDEQLAQAALGLDVPHASPLRYYVQVTRRASVRDSVGSMFMDEILPWLQGLGRPDDVRILFGFDS
jgi:hypothetical protein